MWKFITICFFLIVKGHFAKICPANEVFDECGDGCPRTCANIHETEFSCLKVCFPQCVCKSGFLRSSSGQCVQPSECSSLDISSPEVSCPENEVFQNCGTACPVTCENVNNPREMCVGWCFPQCACANNLIRDTNTGECVLEENCTQVCEESEMFLPCNGPKRCESKCNGAKKCRYKDDCENNCICKDNFFRDRITMTCVPKSQCPMYMGK